jgi:hypothetical protein
LDESRRLALVYLFSPPLIDVPEAAGSGMTFWEHLRIDHLFEVRRIDGLNINE